MNIENRNGLESGNGNRAKGRDLKNKNWNLFLDRDGVINELLPGDYVKKIDEFEFRPAVLEELAILSGIFTRIFIITNQQGVGKGLMTVKDLETVHGYMLKEIGKAGGAITQIYACIHRKEDNCLCRKPQPGLIYRAYSEFPEAENGINIFIGDSAADIELANYFGMSSIGMIHEYNEKNEWLARPRYFIGGLPELRLRILPLLPDALST